MFTSQGGISSYDEFKKVFANNKKLIEEFVVESDMMSMETLENWVEMKAKKRVFRKALGKQTVFFSHACIHNFKTIFRCSYRIEELKI